MRKNLAEFIGTFWLVLGGCGSAVLAGAYIGNLGISLAFGLTVLTMVYALGYISGAHLNPAVTIGLWVEGRFEGKKVIPYIISQILGAIAAAGIIYVIATGNGSDIGNFAANGYGEHSPGGYGLWAALVTELVMTFAFVFIVLGATDSRAPQGFAGVAIGLALTLVHLISIPVTNASVNPARSISQAVFVGGWAMEQLWMFIVIPLAGAVLAGLVYKYLKPKI